MSEELNVKAVTKLTGLNEHTLRAWERRYSAVAPRRLLNGRRVYTREDADRLRLLVQLQDRGYAIGQIAHLDNLTLKGMFGDADRTGGNQGDLLPLPNQQFQSLVKRTIAAVEEALEANDLARIHLELNRARHRFGARIFALDVVSVIMVAVGKYVTDQKYCIWQEHALSAIVKVHLGALLYNMQHHYDAHDDQGKPSVAITTMQGDQHDIGILISAILCATNGVKACYLGPNLPPESLASAASALGATHVLVGKTFQSTELLRSDEDFIKELGNELPVHVEIWLGGCFSPSAIQPSVQQRCTFVPTLQKLDRMLVELNLGAFH